MLRQSGAESGSSRAASTGAARSPIDRATVNDLFNEGELERLKKELDEFMPETWPGAKSLVPQETETPLEVSAETSALAPAQVMEFGERLIAALRALRQPTQECMTVADMAHKLMLTLPEASALSNLSRSHLREALKRGKLKGKIIGRGWRIKRADLDTYVRALI
jgi:excisionase family DNA binding protein